ncbi:LysR family transcriptional regulator [Mesorhizobium sp. PUT5]|uniref:LysR family transcriptional regulator n=1 Tax=Mesorhizobium sp. PUT5 TaxID=3454629 RepID=UPI003FA4CA7D
MISVPDRESQWNCKPGVDVAEPPLGVPTASNRFVRSGYLQPIVPKWGTPTGPARTRVPTHREQTTAVVETSADDDYEESELELPGSTMRRRLIEKGIEQPSALLKGRIPLTSLVQTLAVAEYLNFRHAANVLGVSQSSVSTRVKLLEQELGIMLFERLPRGVRLTNAGRRFVEEVAAGVERLDHAVKTAGMLARGEDGLIRVGVHALHPVGFLIDLLNRYRELHPRVDIQITEGATRDTLMQLRAENLDVTFVAGTPVVPFINPKTGVPFARKYRVPIPRSLTRTRNCWESHLARAQWMTKQGYRRILEQAVEEERSTVLH